MHRLNRTQTRCFLHRPHTLRRSFGLAGSLVLLLAPCFISTSVQAAIGHGESCVFAIDATTNCSESGLFTVDNDSCTMSGVFAVDNRYARADFDRDYDVDLDDLATLMACSFGPGVACSSDCLHVDLDLDGDADQDDFAAFQRCYSGKTTSVAPGCAD